MTNNSDRKTSFIFSVQFQRLYRQHLLSTFLQSFLLWFLSYLTLFIDISDFSNRFMGAVTSLLVLSARLGSMEESLPKTAYFKIIDIWFNWYVGNTFIIILVHVIVDYLRSKGRRVAPRPQPFVTKKTIDASDLLNHSVKIIVFITNLLFIIVYFIFSLL